MKFQGICRSILDSGAYYTDFCHICLDAANQPHDLVVGCRGSPISIYISLEQMNKGKYLSLERCLEMEFGMLGFFLRGKADFYEGVRAKLIDKDGEPDWKHKTIDEVCRADSENARSVLLSIKFHDLVSWCWCTLRFLLAVNLIHE